MSTRLAKTQREHTMPSRCMEQIEQIDPAWLCLPNNLVMQRWRESRRHGNRGCVWVWGVVVKRHTGGYEGFLNGMKNVRSAKNPTKKPDGFWTSCLC